MRLLCKHKVIMARKAMENGLEIEEEEVIKMQVLKIIKKPVILIRKLVEEVVSKETEVVEVEEVDTNDLIRVTFNVTIVKNLDTLLMSVEGKMRHKMLKQEWLSK